MVFDNNNNNDDDDDDAACLIRPRPGPDPGQTRARPGPDPGQTRARPGPDPRRRGLVLAVRVRLSLSGGGAAMYACALRFQSWITGQVRCPTTDSLGVSDAATMNHPADARS
ncbi:unnamed protein product [Lampetra fluviatilis]